MPYDYGFDLPDERHSYYDKGGELVTIHILRDWEFEDSYGDYDEPKFKVRFKIVRGGIVTSLPHGVDESKAISIAETMYPIDETASRSRWEVESMERMERRMGA